MQCENGGELGVIDLNRLEGMRILLIWCFQCILYGAGQLGTPLRTSFIFILHLQGPMAWAFGFVASSLQTTPIPIKLLSSLHYNRGFYKFV